MKKDYNFNLPKSLISYYPQEKRTSSRMMVVKKDVGTVESKNFSSLIDYLKEGDLLILNDTKVVNARLICKRPTGGKMEVFLIRKEESNIWLCFLKNAKNVEEIIIEGNKKAKVISKDEETFLYKVDFKDIDVESLMKEKGRVPLPPYIKREDEESDRERYQTVFATKEGAVAAPTAGLHFDEEYLNKIRNKKIDVDFVTLHTGPATFMPVEVSDIENFKVPGEYFYIDEKLIEKIKLAKKEKRRIIAVGTTVARTLESAFLKAKNIVEDNVNKEGFTDLFIYDDFDFKVVDAMLTNFHLPKSSLLMLVSSFGGYELMMEAYAKAVKEEYGFFSYGDCMFIY